MSLPKMLEPYRLQICAAPFFLVAMIIALSLDVTGNKTEFILISLFYTAGDVLTVNYLVTKNEKGRRISIVLAALIFSETLGEPRSARVLNF
jgi:hypothetical protein